MFLERKKKKYFYDSYIASYHITYPHETLKPPTNKDIEIITIYPATFCDRLGPPEALPSRSKAKMSEVERI